MRCRVDEADLFATPAAFRAWLAANHAKTTELLVGFHKVGSGKPSITWPQSVDQALCYGWIDGVRRSLGAAGYTIRFTPRRPRSIWSANNTKRFAELRKQGQVAAAGVAAFKRRTAARSGVYSFEQRRPAACRPRRTRRSGERARRGPTSSLDRPGTSGPPCLGGQRQEGRDARQAAAHADRRLRGRAHHRTAHAGRARRRDDRATPGQ